MSNRTTWGRRLSVLAAVGAVVAGCGGARPTSHREPSSPPVSSPSPSSSPSAGPVALQTDTQLTKGTVYRSPATFTPALSLSVPTDDWYPYDRGPQVDAFNLREATGTADDQAKGVGIEVAGAPGHLGTVLTALLAAKNLQHGTVHHTTIGGKPAAWVDVHAQRTVSWHVPASLDGEQLTPGSPGRLYVVEGPTGAVVLFASADHARDWSAFLPLAQRVVGSVRFG